MRSFESYKNQQCKSYNLGDVKDSLKRVGEELKDALNSPPFVRSAPTRDLVSCQPERPLWDSANDAAFNTALLRWVYTALSRGWDKWHDTMNRASKVSSRRGVAFWIQVNKNDSHRNTVAATAN